MRPNPLMLRRPDSVNETKTFTDPLQPGVEFPFSFTARARAAFLETRNARAEELLTRFVTGENAEDVFLSDGNPALVTKEIAALIATLMCLEEAAEQDAKIRGEAPERPYSFEEWFAFSECAPTAFEEVVGWGSQLLLRARGLAVNPTMPGKAEESSPTTEPKPSSPSGSN